jgi:hypothetical protein
MHGWQQHVRMATQQSLEAALVLGLAIAVELVGDPLAHLVQLRTSVEPRRGSLDERADEPVRTSASTASATPGRCTFTATSSPSLVRARWDLAERGDGELVDMANSSRTRPSRSC